MEFFLSATLTDGSPVFISPRIDKSGRIDVRASFHSGSTWVGVVGMDVIPDFPSSVVCARCIADRSTALLGLWISVFVPSKKQVMLYTLEGFLDESALFVWRKTIAVGTVGSISQFELFDGPMFVTLQEIKPSHSGIASVMCDAWKISRSEISNECSVIHQSVLTNNISTDIFGEAPDEAGRHDCYQLRMVEFFDGGFGVVLFAPQRIQLEQVLIQFAPACMFFFNEVTHQLESVSCNNTWDPSESRWNIPYEMLWKRVSVVRSLWHADERVFVISRKAPFFPPPADTLFVLTDDSAVIFHGDAPVYVAKKSSFSSSSSTRSGIGVQCLDDEGVFLITRQGQHVWSISPRNGSCLIVRFDGCCSNPVITMDSCSCLVCSCPTRIALCELSEIVEMKKNSDAIVSIDATNTETVSMVNKFKSVAEKSENKIDLLLEQITHLRELISRLSTALLLPHDTDGQSPLTKVFVNVERARAGHQLQQIIIAPGITACRADDSVDNGTWLITSSLPLSPPFFESVCGHMKTVLDALNVKPSSVITPEKISRLNSVQSAVVSAQDILRRMSTTQELALSQQDFGRVLIAISDAICLCSELTG